MLCIYDGALPTFLSGLNSSVNVFRSGGITRGVEPDLDDCLRLFIGIAAVEGIPCSLVGISIASGSAVLFRMEEVSKATEDSKLLFVAVSLDRLELAITVGSVMLAGISCCCVAIASARLVVRRNKAYALLLERRYL